MSASPRHTDQDERMHDAFAANSVDLLHYFERRLDAREDAADLLGETMLVAWRKVESLPTDAERARMWLFTTARFTLANFRRGKIRQHDLFAALRDELKQAVSAEANRDSDANDLDDALAELPPNLAEMIRLVHWDKFTVEEAATLQGLSRATGRRHYNKAIAVLRSDLGYPSARATDSGLVVCAGEGT